MTEEATTGLMNRDEALADLRRRAGEGQSVTNHHKGDDPVLCSAGALLAGLGSSTQFFVYYIQAGRANVCTGLQNKEEVEAKRQEIEGMFETQWSRQRTASILEGLAADDREVTLDDGKRIPASEALEMFALDPDTFRIRATVTMGAS